MSRSKRAPYWTDGYKTKGRKKAKTTANNKVKITEDISDGGAYKKTYCSWNIRDFSFHDPKNPKAYRK